MASEEKSSFPKANYEHQTHYLYTVHNTFPRRISSLLFLSSEPGAWGEMSLVVFFLIPQLCNGTVTAWFSLFKDHSVRCKTCFRSCLQKLRHLGPNRRGEKVCLSFFPAGSVSPVIRLYAWLKLHQNLKSLSYGKQFGENLFGLTNSCYIEL